MKKVVLSFLFASCIVVTSCKKSEEKKEDDMKEVETEVVTEVVTKVEKETELIVENTDSDGFVDIEIPQFSNEDVVKNLKAYSLYARNYIAAKGDSEKLEELAEEGSQILKEGREMVGKLSKADQDNYAKTIAQIQTKIQAK